MLPPAEPLLAVALPELFWTVPDAEPELAVALPELLLTLVVPPALPVLALVLSVLLLTLVVPLALPVLALVLSVLLLTLVVPLALPVLLTVESVLVFWSNSAPFFLSSPLPDLPPAVSPLESEFFSADSLWLPDAAVVMLVDELPLPLSPLPPPLDLLSADDLLSPLDLASLPLFTLELEEDAAFACSPLPLLSCELPLDAELLLSPELDFALGAERSLH